ncbi:unnamed protein product [Brassica oleracea var. botrytis]
MGSFPQELTGIKGSLFLLDHQLRRDRSVIAMGALDLLLVADCAWIWVRSKIRDPPEASTSRAVSLLLRRLAPAVKGGLLSSSTTRVLRITLVLTSPAEKWKLSFAIRSPALRSTVLLQCFISRSKAPSR